MKINCKLTEEQRKERSRKALQARWDKERENPILRATHTGELRIGDTVFPCAVLEDGRRIISETGLSNFLGARTGHIRKLSRQSGNDKHGPFLPVFLAVKALEPYIAAVLGAGPIDVVHYKKKTTVQSGYSADIVPKVCEVWLSARDSGVLSEANMVRAKKADTLMRALACVGINALIDEATGYQEERDRSELQKLFAKYISEEFMPWQRRFPQVYYKELFRLFGWKFDPSSVKRPALLGKFTNEYIYEQMPEGILEELRTKNPPDDKGNRKLRHHQWLTETVGIPHLDKHLTKMITIMQLSEDIEEFKKLFDRAKKIWKQEEALEDKGNVVVIDAELPTFDSEEETNNS